MKLQNTLSPRAASAQLGLTPQCIRAWCLAGRLEHIRLGRRIFIPSAELDRLLSDGLRPRKTA